MADKYILLINDTTANITANLDNNKIALDTDLNKMKVKIGGTIYTLARESQDNTFANTTVSGNLVIDEYMQHSGDTDTNIRFQTDQVSVNVGGVTNLDLTDSTHTIKLNDNAGSTYLDIDDSTGTLIHRFDSLGGRQNRYDGSNYLTETVDSSGNATYSLTGGTWVSLQGYKNEKSTATTTNSTETTLWSVTLDDAECISVEVDVLAISEDANDTAIYKLAGLFKRPLASPSANAAQVGTTTVIKEYEEDSRWDCDFDTNTNDVRLRITGINDTNISWSGYIKWHRLAAPAD